MPTKKRTLLDRMVEPSGLLHDFLLSKLQAYQVPERKGTPRGKKIGLSWKKYNASLLVALTNRRLKDLAKDLSISYGSLRKWKTEEDFMTSVEKHRKEFIKQIVSYHRNQIQDNYKAHVDYFNEGLTDQELGGCDIGKLKNCARLLNGAVLDGLGDAAREEFQSVEKTEEHGGHKWHMALMLYVDFVELGKYARGGDTAFSRRIEAISFKRLVKSLRPLASKKVLSKLDQRFFLSGLSLLEGYFNDQIADETERHKDKTEEGA